MYKAIQDTLTWYEEMGVDVTLEEQPINHRLKPVLMEAPKAQPKPQPQPQAIITVATPVPQDVGTPLAWIEKARKAADAANSREELRAAIEAFEGCSIKKTANNTVFSDGVPTAKVMFIGEAPGASEDVEGIPFCGMSGQLLDHALSMIHLIRKENFYITNSLFWRPPGNRRPTPEEIAMCKPFVEKHIALIKPKLIVLVGGTAVTSVLGGNQAISKIRGKFYDYTNEYLDHSIKTTAVFHPSFLLRSPGQKKEFWFDLLKVEEFLGGV
jgi:uracil-DNA glycosylase family 4